MHPCHRLLKAATEVHSSYSEETATPLIHYTGPHATLDGAHVSTTAELWTTSDAAGTLVYIEKLLREVSCHQRGTLLIDSRTLHNLTTTTHDPTEAINKIDLAAIRQHFTQNFIRHIGCITEHYNLADPRTKNNRNTAALLLKTFRDGSYPRYVDSIIRSTEPSLNKTGDGVEMFPRKETPDETDDGVQTLPNNKMSDDADDDVYTVSRNKKPADDTSTQHPQS